MTLTADAARTANAEQAAEVILELRDVFCVHRNAEGDAAALQGATLELRRGELLSVLGPSGAGKSTLLRVIAGLQTPSAGVVNLLGWDIGRLRPALRARVRRQSIGFLGQHADAVLAPEQTIGAAVELPLALRGVTRRERQRRMGELLDEAGLADRASALPGELSGGERQRAALCAALAHRPALLLADEPTGELDPAGAAQTRALIATLVRSQGSAAIVVSHDPETALIADRSVHLRDGRVVSERGPSGDGIVVSDGGWLQLPPSLLREARIAGRVRVDLTAEGLLLAPSGEAVVSMPRAPARDARAREWSPAVVQAHSVARRRGRGAASQQVLVGFDHRFEPGRLTAVTGPSGVGKTTLLRLLAGFDLPDVGEVTIDGEPTTGRSAEQLAALRRDRVGYLPQEPWPVGFLSAAENVALALRIRGWSVPAAASRAAEVLGWVGLSDRAGQRVARLSAGESQRVALARALASAGGLVIADEPTSRLDRAGAEAVAALLSLAAREDHQTVICATHDPELIRLADAVLVLGG